MTFDSSLYRIIDANLNRAGEGLRVLEDLARLLLDDAALTGQLKALRHSVLEANTDYNRRLLQARDSESDVGVNLEKPSERDLASVAVANARRVQESLRVIEELAKISGLVPGGPEKFKQARFSLYAIEKDLFAGLLRKATGNQAEAARQAVRFVEETCVD